MRFPMDPADFQEKAKELVKRHVQSNNYNIDENTFPEFEVRVVWFAKALQNWKALVITDLPADDGRYYEVTHNGDKRETYVDGYRKMTNTVYVEAPEGVKNYPHTRHIG